jgi:hypothetical protein
MLTEFINTIGNNNTESKNILLTTILQIYNSFLKGHNKLTDITINIKILLPSVTFVTPTYHIHNGNNIKTTFVTTLKGNGYCGTTLLPMSQEEARTFKNYITNINTNNKYTDLKIRKNTIKAFPMLNDINRIVKSKIGEAIIFQSVENGINTVYFEPNCHVSRIMVTITY